MAKFFVKIKEVHTQVIEVDAANKAEALLQAQECLALGLNIDGSELDDDTSYDYTMDIDTWDVFE